MKIWIVVRPTEDIEMYGVNVFQSAHTSEAAAKRRAGYGEVVIELEAGINEDTFTAK